MKLHPTLYGLRDAFRNYCTQYAPDIMAFCSDSLLQDHAERPLSAQSLEVCQKLLKQPPGACATTQSLLDAVRSATPHVCWRQSYTEKDAGIDAFYLSNYGWFNLIAPSGPFVSDTLRLSVGYWEKGLFFILAIGTNRKKFTSLSQDLRPFCLMDAIQLMPGRAQQFATIPINPMPPIFQMPPFWRLPFGAAESWEAKPIL